VSLTFNVGDRVAAKGDLTFITTGMVPDGTPGIVVEAVMKTSPGGYTNEVYEVEFDGYGLREGIFAYGLVAEPVNGGQSLNDIKVGDKVRSTDELCNSKGGLVPAGTVGNVTYVDTADGYCHVNFDGFGRTKFIFMRYVELIPHDTTPLNVGDRVKASCGGIVNVQDDPIPKALLGTVIYSDGKYYDVDFEDCGLAKGIQRSALDLVADSEVGKRTPPRDVDEFQRQQTNDNLASIFGNG
jgi:hypothetical protein